MSAMMLECRGWRPSRTVDLEANSQKGSSLRDGLLSIIVHEKSIGLLLVSKPIA
jgi:hypothetical protein